MTVFETERLRLRCFARRDAADLRALLTDPLWLRHIGDRGVRTDEDAARYIDERLAPSYRDLGHGFWAIERKADGVFVGGAGLLKRATLPDVDVGWALLSAFRGLGYAREAALGCIDHGEKSLGLKRLLAIISPANDRSIKVAESVGMHLVETRPLEADGEVICVYAR